MAKDDMVFPPFHSIYVGDSIGGQEFTSGGTVGLRLRQAVNILEKEEDRETILLFCGSLFVAAEAREELFQ